MLEKRWMSDHLSVENHPLTKWWFKSFSDIEGLEDELYESIFDRLHDLNELTIQYAKEDLLQFLFREYYICENSLETIGAKIGIPKKTLSNWFQRYFGWQSRDSNKDTTENSKILRSESLRWNKNGNRLHERYRDATLVKVEELLNGRTELEKPFSMKEYRRFSSPFYKAQVILRHFWYSKDFFDETILAHHREWAGSQSIAATMNTLLKVLVWLLRVRIIPPKIPKQTIRNRINKY